jgi:hypothetical protein
LPPPSKNSTDWSELPYCANWAGQMAWYLKNYSAQLVPVDVGAVTNVSIYESMRLFMGTGWQGQPTNVPAAPLR